MARDVLHHPAIEESRGDKSQRIQYTHNGKVEIVTSTTQVAHKGDKLLVMSMRAIQRLIEAMIGLGSRIWTMCSG